MCTMSERSDKVAGSRYDLGRAYQRGLHSKLRFGFWSAVLWGNFLPCVCHSYVVNNKLTFFTHTGLISPILCHEPLYCCTSTLDRNKQCFLKLVYSSSSTHTFPPRCVRRRRHTSAQKRAAHIPSLPSVGLVSASGPLPSFNKACPLTGCTVTAPRIGGHSTREKPIVQERIHEYYTPRTAVTATVQMQPGTTETEP